MPYAYVLITTEVGVEEVGKDSGASVDAAELGAEEGCHADDEEQVSSLCAHGLFENACEIPHEAAFVGDDTCGVQYGERPEDEEEHDIKYIELLRCLTLDD